MRLVSSVGTTALVAGAAVTLVMGSPARAASSITEFPSSGSDTMPLGITTGPDGNLWVAEAAGNAIAKVTLAGTFTAFALPNGGSAPVSVAAGPDGNVWFTERLGDRIGK